MWIMTANGFISAVEHRFNENYLLARSRTDEALIYLCDELGIGLDKITHMNDADYVWRVVVSKEEFALFLAREVLHNLRYDNFKTFCKDHGAPEKYLTFLNGVWSKGLDMQEGGLYNGNMSFNDDDYDKWWEEHYHRFIEDTEIVEAELDNDETV